MPYSLPKVQTPTNALVVADLRDDRMDAQIAACVLQGIVNRESEEKIYVHHTYCADNRGDWRVPRTASYRMAHVAEQWLSEVYGDIPQTALAPVEDAECPAFLALLDRYARFVKGVIIFDPRLPDATIEMATTIAGQRTAWSSRPSCMNASPDTDFRSSRIYGRTRLYPTWIA